MMPPAKERIGEIIRRLRKAYPTSRTALKFETPLQLLVATILAAQCTDEKVNQITPILFKKYPTAESLAKAKQEELEAIIKPTGFYRNKAKAIIGAARKIVSDFGGQVPDTMENLITLPGVARKTANIVLSSAFRKAEGIAVDTHVRRLASRLGLSRQKEPNKIEKDLMGLVPKADWLDFNYLLVDHGRKICQARKPFCGECFLQDLCPSAKDFLRAEVLKAKVKTQKATPKKASQPSKTI
ncbi:MAG: endonuclease III [Candidatus Aminicenantes bacterium]|nr:endonuclease III [Candidatus Aminicenantes bacterium]